MKKVKLIIEIDDELLDYIRNGHYDVHLQQRFDCKSKWAIKDGKPLETELEEIQSELEELKKAENVPYDVDYFSYINGLNKAQAKLNWRKEINNE